MGRVFWGSSVIKQRCVNVSFLPCSENSSVQVKRKRVLGQYLGQGATVLGSHIWVFCASRWVPSCAPLGGLRAWRCAEVLSRQTPPRCEPRRNRFGCS